MKFCLLTPSRDALYPSKYLDGLIHCFGIPGFLGSIRIEHDSDIVRARTSLIKRANEQCKIHEDLKYGIFVDSDIVFNKTHAWMLLDAAERFNLDIVGGVYVQRKPELKFVYLESEDEPLELSQEKDIIECKAVGCGFMLVRLPFDLKEDSFHTMHIQYKGKNTYLSEDYAFCVKSNKTIWLHRGVRVGHTGAITYYAG